MREILKKFTLFLSVVFCVLFNIPAFCGVGSVDERYAVTPELWATDRFRPFVRLETTYVYTDRPNKPMVATCTAQYVSKNLILSAGHCILSPNLNYNIVNYKGEKIPVELLKYNFTRNTMQKTKNDWAIFLIKDEKYFSDVYFDIQSPSKTTDVLNAGFGWVRIIPDKELTIIRNLAKTISSTNSDEQKSENTEKSFFDLLSEKISEYNTGKSEDQQIKPLKEETYTLKASDCQIKIESGTENNPLLPTTCDSWSGNSGGGYINGNVLYGVCSGGAYGAEEFEDETNMDNMASARAFLKDFRSIKNNNLLEGETPLSENSEDNSTVNALTGIETGINNTQADVNTLSEILSKYTDVSQISDEQFLSVLSKWVEFDVKKTTLEQLKDAYEDAKKREQSLGNRMLTAATVAATGIGAMELAQGLSEQRADKAAAEDMAAYIATFRCDYGGGKSVKAGPDEIELPGGNNQTLMNYRAEYFALANDLKDRKTALNIKPGIESEAILDKTQLGLYDDENTGITSGAEASLYRAQMLKSESDQSKLDEASSTSQKRVNGGAIALGAGVVGGIVGNAIINRNKDSKDNIANVAETVCSKIDGASWKNGKCYCVGNNKKFENGKCVDAGPVDSNETLDNKTVDVPDTEPEQNSEKVKECVEWINEHVVLFGTGGQIYTVQIIPDENSAWLVVSQEQSKSLSPNWDFSTQESYKLYLDGSQDYEQNACETVERIQAFLAGKVKENCTDIPGFKLVCDLCIQSSAESNIFEFTQALCKEEEQPIENDCPEPKHHEPCTLECQRKISPEISGDWTKNATETWWYKDKYGWKCVSKTCKKGYKTNNGFCKKGK